MDAAARLTTDGSRLTTDAIRDLMWRSVGLFRTRVDIERAVSALDEAYRAAPIDAVRGTKDGPDSWQRFHLITVARLIARAALGRQERPGAHFRDDFPKRDDRAWKVHLVDQKGAA